ncbi:sugar phosphate isomerase/epimerase family protein [Paenibacillus mesotrionivorans]|uniref:Sugar phosphate isomerase/epimerase family protein n=1 Tax=Paenibacillus mesotrionivorans TaxID=3160968 RepID=A0ACC7NV98_9BACL
MKLSISNIAWEKEEDTKILPILKEYGFLGVEVAPTKINNPVSAITKDQLQKYRDFWNSNGIQLNAMQSLLFGRPDIILFDSKEKQQEAIGYFGDIFTIAQVLGVQKLVFGSPKNRLIKGRDQKEVFSEAVSLFEKIGELAHKKEVVFCIEPNPLQYGCDFVTTSIEALQLVKAVNHPGFGLHLDTGTMIINNESPANILEQCMPYIQHFHISEPFLDLIGSNTSIHREISIILKEYQYSNWISIEMKNNIKLNNYEAVNEAIHFVAELYQS